jgi:hypothetical protein
VEEAAAAAESLQEQAAKLAEAVSVFKLEGTTHGMRAQPPVQKNVVVDLPRAKAGPESTAASSGADGRRKKRAAAGGGHGDEWEAT